MTISNGNNGGVMQFGDTTLTKVFVGGLAWETPKEALREHFEKFGDILEAVIISDKTTGKSKGYGFVTFKNPEAANKACEDPTPVINGRRANCNLASLGARRPSKHQPPNNTPHHPQPQQVNGGQRAQTATPPPPPPPNQVQWYYPGAGTPPAPFHHHQHHQAIPFYAYARYSPAYIATDVSYNHKVNYNGGCYVNGQYSQMYPGQPIGGAAAAGTNTLMPIYPLYHFHHQSHTMGLPAPPHHIIPSVTGPPPLPTVPTIISKPPSMAPTSGTVVVGKGESF